MQHREERTENNCYCEDTKIINNMPKQNYNKRPIYEVLRYERKKYLNNEINVVRRFM